MNQTPNPVQSPSILERWLSVFLLGVLVLIVGAVLVLQRRYDAGEWREQAKKGNAHPLADLVSPSIEGLKALSAIEIYDASTLSDKINGKAELYLAAGFKQLESRRFGLSADTTRWMERYVYRMANYRSAFAVFSGQRRADVQLLEMGSHAYTAANGLFLVHGPYYVEIIASEVADDLQAAAMQLARAFVTAHKVTAPPLVEMTLFPEQGRVIDSRMLTAASTFGIKGLDWVYTCRYIESGHEALAFISRRASADEAGTLAHLFISQWLDYDGKAVPLGPSWSNARAVTILDNYEIVWVQGQYLVGVHEGTDLDFSLGLAKRLRQAVKEGQHGP